MCGELEHHSHDYASDRELSRRTLLGGTAIAGAAALAAGLSATPALAQADPYAPPAEPALPPSDMKLNLERAALVVTDPQVKGLESMN